MFVIEKFNALLKKHDKVTILTHRNPDADTLGTGLGLYALLKSIGKQVEICNPSKDLPKHLDFLPHFAKIKSQINFGNSLIITCDSGSIDLLGFDLSLREIVNIDHHKSNTNYGTLNIVDSTCVSISMVAYKLLKNDFMVSKEVATCFYVASELIAIGINLEVVNRNLTQRKSLSSLRVLSATLETLDLYEEAQISSMLLSKNILEKTGATLNDRV